MTCSRSLTPGALTMLHCLYPMVQMGGDRNGDGRADDRFIVIPTVVALVAGQRLGLCF